MGTPTPADVEHAASVLELNMTANVAGGNHTGSIAWANQMKYQMHQRRRNQRRSRAFVAVGVKVI